MPLYLYQHPETGEIKEVLQKMKDVHEYSESGVKWDRVFQKPNASVDSQLDADDSRAFVRKTDNKGMKLGDMFDLSKSLSEKRTKKYGKDPIKEKTAREYQRKTQKEHPLINK